MVAKRRPEMQLGGARMLVRADADFAIGTGHVMRCLALAQGWQELGGEVTFLHNACPGGLARRLRDEGADVLGIDAPPGTAADSAETAALAARLGARWVAVDGYAFGSEYQQALRREGLKVLLIDDYGHCERYSADIVVNQNVYATPDLYDKRETHTSLLIGAGYALLRREFWSWEGWQRLVPDEATRILITLGGSDPMNVTGLVVEGLESITGLQFEAVVLIGTGNPHLDSIRRRARNDPRIRVAQPVADMPALMTWADMGVTAGGSTCYEAAHLGLPCLVTSFADNQRPVAAALAKLGVVEPLGPHDALTARSVATAMQALMADRDRRAEMAKTGQELVPGDGAISVVREMVQRGRSSATPYHRYSPA